MKTIQANSFETARKQLSNYPEIQVPEVINELDKNHIHVVFIDRVHNERERRYENKVMIKKFSVEAYEMNKKEFSKLGYGEMFIFHDPRVKAKQEPEKPSASVEDVLELISKAESIEEVEKIVIEGETRKTILKAAEKKIEQLKK